MRLRTRIGTALVLLSAVSASSAFGLQEQQAPVSYHNQIAPLLLEKCAGCHQPAKAKGKLSLTSYAELIAGGESGASIVSGNPAASLLIQLVQQVGDAPPEMPAEGSPLAEPQVALLVRWIAEGAVDDTPLSVGVLPSSKNPPVYKRAPVISAIAASPDGKWVAVSGFHEVLLHSIDATQASTRLIGASERVESLAFAPDGRTLAVGAGTPGRLGELQLWDVEKATLRRSVPASHDSIFGVSWSPDGRLVAFGCTDKSVRAIDATSGEQVLYQGAHDDWVLGTCFSSDGSHLVSIGRDRSMKLIQVATQQFIDNITSITPGALKGGLMAVERRPGTDEVLAAGADSTPRLYKMYRVEKRVIGDDFNLIRAYEPLQGRVFALSFSPDGQRFVAGSSSAGNGEIACYQVDAPAPLWRQTQQSAIYCIDWLPDGKQIVAGTHAGTLLVLAAGDGQVVRESVAVPLQVEAVGQKQL